MNLRRRLFLGAIASLAFASRAFGAADGSRLELPKGADLAVVVFEDLQCPDCAKAHPQLLAATRASAVPLVIHDFPIPRHAWAFSAAILARWFTQQSPALGVEFRTHVFEHQRDVTPETLRSVAEAFARDHHLVLPAQVDADGSLHAAVQADFDFGNSIGLEYVPLMFVVSRDAGAFEVTDVEKLGAMIDGMKARQESRASAQGR